jgi:hypothetical protein
VPPAVYLLKPFCHLLAPVTLGTASLLFALLALRDEVHLLTIGLRDSLRDDPFIKAADQLLDRFAITSFYTHTVLDLPQMNHYSYGVRLGLVRGARAALTASEVIALLTPFTVDLVRPMQMALRCFNTAC